MSEVATKDTRKQLSDFRQAIEDNGIKRWNIHNCSMCGYACGYVINSPDDIWYDSGCDCSYGALRPSSLVDIADHYNRNQPIENPRIKQKALDKMNKFWGFDD
jgi:hypothetical protein